MTLQQSIQQSTDGIFLADRTAAQG